MSHPSLPLAPILFIGLGAMGSRMVPHLASSDNSLLFVCDQDHQRATEIAVKNGARAIPLDEIISVLPSTRAVILMLPDSGAVESLLSDEFFDALTPGALIVDMGSSRPESTVALAERATNKGIKYLDAPVSGGTQRAADGSLTIMVGAADEDFTTVSPLLNRLGKDVAHVGGHGAGHALKALNNLLSAIGLAAASEVLAIGSKFGLKASTMVDILNTATGRNHATEIKFKPYILSHKFDSGFALKLMVKDLKLALDLADSTQTQSPIVHVAVSEWIKAEKALEPGADHTHFAAYVEDIEDIRFE